MKILNCKVRFLVLMLILSFSACARQTLTPRPIDILKQQNQPEGESEYDAQALNPPMPRTDFTEPPANYLNQD